MASVICIPAIAATVAQLAAVPEYGERLREAQRARIEAPHAGDHPPRDPLASANQQLGRIELGQRPVVEFDRSQQLGQVERIAAARYPHRRAQFLARRVAERGPVVGTLILGALWGLWHLPFFFGPLARTGPDATFVSASIALVEFSIGLTGLSVIMTWVLNNCGGSVLLAILIHAAFDSSGLALVALFPSTAPYYVPVHYQTLGIAIVFSVAALVLIVATRGRLSYQRYLQEAEEEPDVATAQA